MAGIPFFIMASDDPNRTMAPYIEDVENDLEARKDWAYKDDEIKKRRLGERNNKNKPYPDAPNPVEPLIDDVVRDKVDQEISMMVNAPLLCYFIPLQEGIPNDLTMKTQRAFDTYLRHFIDYRRKREQASDTKNCRGFAVDKVKPIYNDMFGTEIPSFETIDPQDVIVPVDAKVPVSIHSERVCFVSRFSRKQLEDKKEEGWINVDKVLDRLAPNADNPAESAWNEGNALKRREELIGLNVSDYSHNSIVIWEICHLASEWDLKHQDEFGLKLEKNQKIISYVCPDVPEKMMQMIVWKEDDVYEELQDDVLMAELAIADAEGREPVTRKLLQIGKDKPWPLIQHRYENRSPHWYDTRGLGETCMDDQLIATTMTRKKLIWADFASNMLFQDNGEGTNPQNIKIKPGTVLPANITPATLPQPPNSFDFEVDARRRTVAARAGAGSSLYDAEVTQSRKLEKTATQQRSEDAKQGNISSASVERFNDPDKELYMMLWNDLKSRRIPLPIINGRELEGTAPIEIYDVQWLIIPATSQKTSNPELQFMQNQAAIDWAAQYLNVAPQDIAAGVQYALTYANPDLANLMKIDPNQAGPQGQPPIYQVLQNLTDSLKQIAVSNDQQDTELEQVQKLAVENADKIEEMKEKNAVQAKKESKSS